MLLLIPFTRHYNKKKNFKRMNNNINFDISEKNIKVTGNNSPLIHIIPQQREFEYVCNIYNFLSLNNKKYNSQFVIEPHETPKVSLNIAIVFTNELGYPVPVNRINDIMYSSTIPYFRVTRTNENGEKVKGYGVVCYLLTDVGIFSTDVLFDDCFNVENKYINAVKVSDCNNIFTSCVYIHNFHREGRNRKDVLYFIDDERKSISGVFLEEDMKIKKYEFGVEDFDVKDIDYLISLNNDNCLFFLHKEEFKNKIQLNATKIKNNDDGDLMINQKNELVTNSYQMVLKNVSSSYKINRYCGYFSICYESSNKTHIQMFVGTFTKASDFKIKVGWEDFNAIQVYRSSNGEFRANLLMKNDIVKIFELSSKNLVCEYTNCEKLVGNFVGVIKSDNTNIFKNLENSTDLFSI